MSKLVKAGIGMAIATAAVGFTTYR